MKIRKIVIASLLVFLAGAIIFTIGFSMAGFDISRIGTDMHYQTKTYESEKTFQSIRIEDKNVPVQIHRSSDQKISVSYSENERAAYEITEQGDTLIIKKSEKEMNFASHFNISFRSYNLILSIPESFSGDISVTTSNSSIHIDDIKAKDLTLNTTNAQITLEDTEASGNITAATSGGELAYDSVKANTLNLTTSNGEIDLSDIEATGSVLLKTSNAAISFDDLYFQNALTCTSSNGSVKGGIVGKMSDFSLNCDTSNGTCNIPEKSEQGSKDITIVTSNGDIELEFSQDV